MRISDGSSDVFSSDLRAEFETLMYQNYKQAGANSDQTNQYATGLNIGTGVKVVGTERINTQGAMQATDNPTDMAINGQGFFQEIGRASGRARVCQYVSISVVDVSLKKKGAAIIAELEDSKTNNMDNHIDILNNVLRHNAGK